MSRLREKSPTRTNPSLPVSLRTSAWSHIKPNASIKEGLKKKPKQTCSIEEGVKGGVLQLESHFIGLSYNMKSHPHTFPLGGY